MKHGNHLRINFHIVVLISALSILAPRFSYGALVPCGNDGNLCTFDKLSDLARNVVHFALFDIAIPLAVLMIVIGGITILLSGGNESKVKKGKDMITGTLVGLLIAFGAWLIVNTIVTVFFS